MRQALSRRTHEVPTAATMLKLLGRLPQAVKDLPRQRAWSDDVPYYAAVLTQALPKVGEHATDLAGRIQTGLQGMNDAEDAVHGDLYEGQLLLGDGKITGLLDVDTLGPGRRADDLACLLAHLQVLAQAEPHRESATLALAARWLSDSDPHLDPVELRYRTAGVVLSLAPGPHRVQEPGWHSATRAHAAQGLRGR